MKYFNILIDTLQGGKKESDTPQKQMQLALDLLDSL